MLSGKRRRFQALFATKCVMTLVSEKKLLDLRSNLHCFPHNWYSFGDLTLQQKQQQQQLFIELEDVQE